MPHSDSGRMREAKRVWMPYQMEGTAAVFAEDKFLPLRFFEVVRTVGFDFAPFCLRVLHMPGASTEILALMSLRPRLKEPKPKAHKKKSYREVVDSDDDWEATTSLRRAVAAAPVAPRERRDRAARHRGGNRVPDDEESRARRPRLRLRVDRFYRQSTAHNSGVNYLLTMFELYDPLD